MHREEQERARAEKKAKREAREKEAALAAFRRACKTISVPKDDLLRLLIDASFVEEGATRIVATGHRPDDLTVTYTKELAHA